MIYDFGTGIEYTENNNIELLELFKHKYTIVKKYADKKININSENKWLTFEMAIDYANKQSVNKSLNTGDY